MNLVDFFHVEEELFVGLVSFGFMLEFSGGLWLFGADGGVDGRVGGVEESEKGF